MHLVIPAHVCFFWVICHPSRTFPLKELEWEPQNRLIPFPPLPNHILSYLWPMTHLPCIGWAQVSGAWAYVCSTPIWVHCFFGVHTFAIAYGFVWSCYMFCRLFNSLWRGWVIESSFFATRFFFGLGIA